MASQTTLVGWRKWTFFLLVIVSGFVLALLGKLTAEVAQVYTVASLAMAGGNAFEHWAKSRKG
jgi:hypothetical protein